MRSGWVTSTVLGCTDFPWSSRGNFLHRSPNAALLPFQTGIFQIAIYRIAPPNKSCCVELNKGCVPKSLFVPAAGICLQEDIASLQKLCVVDIPRMSGQLQHASRAQTRGAEVCAVQDVCGHVWVLIISRSK